MTLVAGLFPSAAIRATRVPLIAAVEGATLPRGRFAHFTPYIASLDRRTRRRRARLRHARRRHRGRRLPRCSASACSRLHRRRDALLAARPPAREGRSILARRLGGAAGKLAERNAQRNPGRTAATAAAPMIGIALVTFISVLANGLRVSNSDAIER